MLFKSLQLIIYAAVPLLGLLFFGWDWRQIIILYWLENITVGIAAIINIINTPTNQQLLSEDISEYSGTLRPTQISDQDKPVKLENSNIKYVMAAFFTFHYGIFTFVHGLFVFSLTLGWFTVGSMPVPNDINPDFLANIFLVWLITTIIQTVALVIRRMDSAIQHPSLLKSMTSPYARIAPLHLAIILGSVLIIILDLPSIAAIILIVIHLILDLRETRTKDSAPNTPPFTPFVQS